MVMAIHHLHCANCTHCPTLPQSHEHRNESQTQSVALEHFTLYSVRNKAPTRWCQKKENMLKTLSSSTFQKGWGGVKGGIKMISQYLLEFARCIVSNVPRHQIFFAGYYTSHHHQDSTSSWWRVKPQATMNGLGGTSSLLGLWTQPTCLSFVSCYLLHIAVEYWIWLPRGAQQLAVKETLDVQKPLLFTCRGCMPCDRCRDLGDPMVALDVCLRLFRSSYPGIKMATQSLLYCGPQRGEG